MTAASTVVTFVRSRLSALRTDELGATSIEYGLIASLVVIVIIAGITGFGEQLAAQWDWVSGLIRSNVKSS